MKTIRDRVPLTKESSNARPSCNEDDGDDDDDGDGDLDDDHWG